jgi:hypothetical protein
MHLLEYPLSKLIDREILVCGDEPSSRTSPYSSFVEFAASTIPSGATD